MVFLFETPLLSLCKILRAIALGHPPQCKLRRTHRVRLLRQIIATAGCSQLNAVCGWLENEDVIRGGILLSLAGRTRGNVLFNYVISTHIHSLLCGLCWRLRAAGLVPYGITLRQWDLLPTRNQQELCDSLGH